MKKIEKYEDAMKRLEEIVSGIEGNKLDIDQIGDSLKEARDLIKFCKDKLYKTDEEINKILGTEELPS
ncbi:MAG: exodeoxyribonuclease VII small subunit [Bacteroidaceae bacterium]|nr:exodeoxyribonuclease VII small subunit [Bacteroidaceae bacterium]MBP5645829.1 exodeoxyribonuclease VII small subunit [Bacteroidaceae bacterium]